MTLALGIGIAATALSAWVLVRAAEPKPNRATVGCRATSPLDEAERVLASRYARGEITFDEYERMSTLLRR